MGLKLGRGTEITQASDQRTLPGGAATVDDERAARGATRSGEKIDP
jgi:hypothetical protein